MMDDNRVFTIALLVYLAGFLYLEHRKNEQAAKDRRRSWWAKFRGKP